MDLQLETAFQQLGILVPRILLPDSSVDDTKFAVVAGDQYSADPEYWDCVERFVGDAPSALRLMLPEAWLKTPERGGDINETQRDYLARGVLREAGEFFVFVHRETAGGVRRGLVTAFDLEEYSYTAGATGLIRSTEETVVERLPARIQIRKNAPIEMPHIMILVDDRDNVLMGGLDACIGEMQRCYDFDLMMDAGHIAGYAVAENRHLSVVAGALEKLRRTAKENMLFAMGDGNHSFAAAKNCWDQVKDSIPKEQWYGHPARYALAELVNLYDPALAFEPIHRALLDVDPEAAQREMGIDAANPPPLQQLQPVLDAWFEKHPQAELEYIHGEAECRALCDRPDRLAIILPEFDKSALFDIVLRDGALVRKSFSMGHASDKRFYLECRKIQ